MGGRQHEILRMAVAQAGGRIASRARGAGEASVIAGARGRAALPIEILRLSQALACRKRFRVGGIRIVQATLDSLDDVGGQLGTQSAHRVERTLMQVEGFALPIKSERIDDLPTEVGGARRAATGNRQQQRGHPQTSSGHGPSQSGLTHPRTANLNPTVTINQAILAGAERYWAGHVQGFVEFLKSLGAARIAAMA